MRESAEMRESKQYIKPSHSQIFGLEADLREESTDLKFLFIFSLILLLIELLLMFHKHHFFTLLSVLSVFAMFFLNYFDRTYVKFVLASLILAFVLNFVWLIPLAGVTCASI